MDNDELLMLATITFLLVIFGFLLTMVSRDSAYTEERLNRTEVKFGAWNLQVYGDTKSSNQALDVKYADKIDDYDIIFLQEIRDKDGSAVRHLCKLVPEYDCIYSKRAGSTQSKEQYVVLYKKTILVTDKTDNTRKMGDEFERPPFEVVVKQFGHEFTFVIVHIKPDNAVQEIASLETYYYHNNNTIILGDLNADCSYYDNSYETYFDDWSWAIADNQDTTVSGTDCAYDRIIISPTFSNTIHSISIDNRVTEDMSDHYIIGGVLS